MRYLKMLAMGFVALLFAVCIGAGFLYGSHPRNEAAFLGRMQDSWNDELRMFIDESPKQVVREGDRACEWLHQQSWAVPDLGGDISGDVTGGELLTRYSRETRGQGHLKFSEHQGRMTRYIALTAWLHLCGAEFELRHTHHPLAPVED